MSNDLLLVDEVSGVGEWWLPGKEGHTVVGDFNYSPKSGVRVRLYGSLHEEPLLAFTEDLDLQLVLGNVKIDGRNFRATLLDCIEVSSSFQLMGDGVSQSEILAHVAFMGATFSDLDELLFDELLVSMNGLDEWALLSGIEFSQEEDVLVVKQRELRPVLLLDDGELSVYLQVINGGVSHRMVQKKVNLTQRTFFSLRWESPIDFQGANRAASTLADFLTLATGELAAPLHVTAYSENAKVELDGGRSYKQQIQVLYQPSLRADYKEPLPPMMTFTFRQEKERIPHLLRRWFDNARELKPVHDLYFGTIRQGSSYPSQRFLNAVQALESFHRRTSSLSEEQVTKTQQKIDRIKDAAKELRRADQKFLEWKLSHALEPSLQQRLEDIQSRLGNMLPELFVDERIVQVIADTRNYLTHYDVSLEHRAVTDGARLYRLSEVVLLLVHVCLLSRLFDEEDLSALVQTDPIRRRVDWLRE